MKQTLMLLLGAALAAGALSGCAPELRLAGVCGDGAVDSGEGCDDGNGAAGDGCAACAVEPGYACTGAPSACAPVCGDGAAVGGEACDGADLGGQTCETIGAYLGGTLGCTADCTHDTLGCDPFEDCNNGGDEDGDGFYDCADTECQGRAPCDSGLEVVCDDARDNDSDGLLDCADPSDCQGLAMCVPGTGAVGSPCQQPNECQATGGDPFCIDAADLSTWLEGYCSEFCSLATPDCPAGSSCFDAGLTGVGLCLATCDDSGDCRAGYTCNQFGVRRMCWPGTEICDNGVDDENDGDIDCDDAQCATFSACAVCGDGVVATTEQCDDGNAAGGDGCSETCQLEGVGENEPNDACAQPDGPLTPDVVVIGTVDGADYSDIYAINVPEIADLTIRILTESDCDAPFYFYGRDCGNFLAYSCDQMSSTSYAGLQRLTPGLYYIEVVSWSSELTPYTLQITYDAFCGNGIVEGSEECDGGQDCTAACKPVSVCGDGTTEGNEQCDDGNVSGGDGCDASCQLEVIAEPEGNDSCEQPNGPYTPDFIVSGAIEAAGAEDWFTIGLSQKGDLRIETYGAAGPGTCDGDTTIELYSPDCMTSIAYNDDYSSLCSLLDPTQFPAVHDLDPGFYKVRVRGYSSQTPSYRMRVSVNYCGDGERGGLEECDGGPDCTEDCRLITDCGDGQIEGTEQCEPPDVVTCNLSCKHVVAPESQCGDLDDGDGDGLTDCEDPDGCKALPACTPGSTPAGGPCTAPSDCQANDADPICFSFIGSGYCSEFCNLAMSDCPAGSTCINHWGFPSGAGTCMKDCMMDVDCNPGSYCFGNFCGF